MLVKCEICGVVFNRTPSQVKRSTHIYCSKECKHKGFDKKLMSVCTVCDKEFKHSRSRVNPQCCSKICQGISRRKGDCVEDPRGTIEYKRWRFKVYEKDDFTCQKCGDNSGGNLNAHHILSFSKYPEFRLTIDNGSTLCKSCHKLFHKDYGYTHFTDKDYWDYLKGGM